MPTEVEILKERVQKLENELRLIILTDRLRFPTRIELNADVGTMIGLTTREKLGFWGTLPVLKNTAATGKQDTSGSSGTTMTTGHAFNGNTGTLYYTVGDIVYELKRVGLLAT